MDPLVQNIVALLLCCAAAAYVGYRCWLTFRSRKSSGCASGCSTCPSSQAADSRPKLVFIEPPKR